MKRLTFLCGDRLSTVMVGEDEITSIEFDEVTQLAKIFYEDGATSIIKSPFISLMTLPNKK